MSFLTAQWRKLIMINYTIDPKILEPYVPYGTEIDFHNGKCYISLIGFMFLNTKIKGIAIPFHKNFEEINLRFYVRRFENGIWKRGVVFISEIVPKPAITLVANILYRENYEYMPMKHTWDISPDVMNIKYSFKKDNQWQDFSVTAENTITIIEKDGHEEFITEHYFGYAKRNNNKTIEYSVAHPKWQMYPVRDHSIAIDFTTVYGDNFSSLENTKPESVLLIEGSKTSIEEKRIIKKPN